MNLSPEYLKQLAYVIKRLDAMEYPDSTRTGKEILAHTEESGSDLEMVLSRLEEDEPWQYIRGWAEFCGLKFIVNQDVLIPRIETEQLVEMGIESAREALESGEFTPNNRLNIVDVGTGSGCIIISVWHGLKPEERESCSFYGLDISRETLEVARENKERLVGESKIEFVESDLLDGVKIDLKTTALFLTNLPYLSELEYRYLEMSVAAYEPKRALFGGIKGIEIYLQLFEQITELHIEYKAIIEASDSTIYKLKDAIQEKHLFAQVKVVRDQYGKDRFLLIFPNIFNKVGK